MVTRGESFACNGRHFTTGNLLCLITYFGDAVPCSYYVMVGIGYCDKDAHVNGYVYINRYE
jgi:hypothetical protein